MTLEKLGGTFLKNFESKKHELFSSDVSKKFGAQTVTTSKPKTISRSGTGSASQPYKSPQPNRNLVSPFLTGNIRAQPSKFIINNNIGQSSNSGLINRAPERQLQQINVNAQPRNQIGFISTIEGGGSVQVFSQTEVRTVDRIRQEQRDARILNEQQKNRFNQITASNYGINALGGGKNILGGVRPFTPLGIEFRTDGAKAVVNRKFPTVENPTFTFGGTFGEKGNLVKQRTNNLSEPEIRSILDQTPRGQQPSPQQIEIFGPPREQPIFGPTRDSIPLITTPAPVSLDVFGGGLPSGQAVQQQAPKGLSVFGGQTARDPVGKFFGFSGQGVSEGAENVRQFGLGAKAQAQNTASDIFDLNKITGGVLGGSFGLFASRLTENPIPRIPTSVETFYEGAIGSALASEPLESGALKGLPSGSGEIFTQSLLVSQRQQVANPAFEAGATSFGIAELLLPVGPISKVAKGQKLLGSPAFVSGISDYFSGLFKTTPEVVAGGKTKVTDKITGYSFESEFAPKIEVGRELFTPKTEKAKRLSEETAFRQGDDTRLIKSEKGKFSLEKLETEDVGTLKTTSGVPKELDFGTDEFGKAIIGPVQPKKPDIASGLPTSRIGDDILSPELKSIYKGTNVDINLKAREIKQIGQEYKNLNNPFKRTDKGTNSIVKGVNREEAEKIYKIRNENIAPKTIEDVRIFNKVKKNKDDPFVGLGSTFLDTGTQAPNILGFGKTIGTKTKSGKQFLKFIDEPSRGGNLLIGKGKGFPKPRNRQKTIFEEPNPKSKLNIFDNSPNFKRPSLKAIGLGIAGGTGIGLGTFGLLNQDAKIKDDQIFGDGNLGLLDDLEITVTEGIGQDQLPKLDQDQILGERFDDDVFPNFPTGQPQDQVPEGGFIPQLGLLQFQGNPPPIPFGFNARFDPIGSGGDSGRQSDEGDFSFYRVFAVAKRPFGKTTVPLGGFVDADRPIDRISDVLSTAEIFRENRRTRNPLRAPKNIVDDDPFLDNLFGITRKKKKGKGKKKGKKKSSNIFDLDIYA